MYRGHAWALTHPLTYSGVGIDGRGNCSMLHRGMGTAKEWRGSQAVYSGADWVFTAATSGGTILPSKFYQPPPTWWHEHSRSILWIQGDVDTLVIFDRSHVDDPLTLPGFDKYDDTDASAHGVPRACGCGAGIVPSRPRSRATPRRGRLPRARRAA